MSRNCDVTNYTATLGATGHRSPVARRLRALSICSGVGMLDLAMELAGFRIAGQVEIDPFCRRVLAKHWPRVKRMADVKEVQGHEFGSIDLLAGGIPCQPFSAAGHVRGTEDDRHLWPYAFRLIQALHPRWVVIENVDKFLPMVFDLVSLDLESEGYEVGAALLPACAVQAPHIRTRSCIVAYAHRQRSISGKNETQQYVQSRGGGSSVMSLLHGARPQTMQSPHPQGALGPASMPHESRMGGDADGLAHWLDGSCFPAMPHENPKAGEPPRLIATAGPYHDERLKALGNGVVWQQFFPIFQAIMQWETEGEAA